jgi:hypothetical protein
MFSDSTWPWLAQTSCAVKSTGEGCRDYGRLVAGAAWAARIAGEMELSVRQALVVKPSAADY